jgi:tetratricopeptide (TPR) repeat protein
MPPIESESHAIDLPPAAPAAPAAPAEAEITGNESGEATDASPSEASATELRSRVNELLAEALTHYEQGRKEEALGVLERLFILDEQNDAARALRENIQAELGEQAGAAEASAQDAPAVPEAAAEPDMEPLSAAQPAEHEPPPALAPQAPAIMPEAQDEGVGQLDLDSEVGEFDIDESEEDGAEMPSLAEAAEKRRTRGKGLSKQSMLVVAAVVVIAAVGGGLAWYFMGGPGGSGEGDGSSENAVAQAGGGVPVNPVPMEPAQGEPPALTQSEGVESQPSDPGSGGSESQQVRGLMAKAQNAMDKGDYAGAVLAFNKVLELDPTHAEARASLDEAGELYREQKSLNEKRENAYDAFNRGNYRAALQILYRLPKDEDGERLNRYMRNGWYNMGLQALRAYNCGSAVTNFKEARDLDPDDHEVLLALDLARTCRFSKNNQAFHDEVRGMAFRGLED